MNCIFLVVDLTDNESDLDSEDSVKIEKKTRKLKKKSIQNSLYPTGLDTFSSSSDDSDGEDKQNKSLLYDSDEDKTDPCVKSKAKKTKEKKKSRLFFQVIRKRRECNSNFDSANEDYDVILT